MPDHADPIVALSELVYKQASSALAEQQRVLEGLRHRAGTLLTAAAISTSFLGGQSLESGSLRMLSWLAISCFIGVGTSSLAILWPRLAVELTAHRLSTSRVREVSTADAVSPVLLAFADHLHLAYDRNEKHIARVARHMRTGSIFLAFEVVWWVADLATRT